MCVFNQSVYMGDAGEGFPAPLAGALEAVTLEFHPIPRGTRPKWFRHYLGKQVGRCFCPPPSSLCSILHDPLHRQCLVLRCFTPPAPIRRSISLHMTHIRVHEERTKLVGKLC